MPLNLDWEDQDESWPNYPEELDLPILLWGGGWGDG